MLIQYIVSNILNYIPKLNLKSLTQLLTNKLRKKLQPISVFNKSTTMAIAYLSFFCLFVIALTLKYYQHNDHNLQSIIDQVKNIIFLSSDGDRKDTPATSSKSNQSKHLKYIEFKQFQKQYILAFTIAMLSDWMQGPYVYKLYHQFGFTTQEIAYIYILGSFTGALTGVFVGSFSDKFGRKFACLLFCLLYGLSCLTKHFNDFGILCFGRVLGGISTSILHSSFEAWMVTHHHYNGFNKSQLTQTFQLAWSLNSIMAIFAGIITSNAIKFYKIIYYYYGLLLININNRYNLNVVDDFEYFETDYSDEIDNSKRHHPVNDHTNNSLNNTHSTAVFEVAAFDCAFVALMITFGIIYQTWTENYGHYLDSIKKYNKDRNSDIVLTDDDESDTGNFSDISINSDNNNHNDNEENDVLINKKKKKIGDDNPNAIESSPLPQTRNMTHNNNLISINGSCNQDTTTTTKNTNTNKNTNIEKSTMVSKISSAFCLILFEDRRVLCLGCCQAFFESSMYIFVFCWTPALGASDVTYNIDHGWIFADFMTACLIGTILSNIFTKQYKILHEKLSILITLIASISIIFVCIFFNIFLIKLLLFIIFEICCGMYWPTMSYLRSKYIPDTIRATVMTIFRVPLNFFIVIVLFYVEYIGIYYSFLCAFLLLIASILSSILLNRMAIYSKRMKNSNTSSIDKNEQNSDKTGSDELIGAGLSVENDDSYDSDDVNQLNNNINYLLNDCDKSR